MWFLLGRMPYMLSEGGSRPASRLTFLLVQESKQRTQPLLPTSPSLRCGATCTVNLLWLYGKTHCVLAALRSDTLP